MMNQKIVCMYHKIDFDGKCSGAIVRHRYPDCELYGIDYGDKFDVDRIKGRDVIMVDYTLEKDNEMQILDQESRMLIWIDHHKTALTIEEQFDLEHIPGIRQVSTDPNDPMGNINKNRISGCELTWRYLFENRRLPYTIWLLGRYDIWDKSDEKLWDEVILPYQYGMRLQHAEPDDIDFWTPHLRSIKTDQAVVDVLTAGKAALAYDENLSERIATGLWFPIEFKGFKFQAINRSHANSHCAKAIWNPEEYDAVMYFSRGPKIWKITMFTDKEGIDLYPLAKSMGGGGHSQACGFTLTNIMEILPQLIEF
jgi:hypothetical protein